MFQILGNQNLPPADCSTYYHLSAKLKSAKTINSWCPSHLQIRISLHMVIICQLDDGGGERTLMDLRLASPQVKINHLVSQEPPSAPGIPRRPPGRHRSWTAAPNPAPRSQSGLVVFSRRATSPCAV